MVEPQIRFGILGCAAIARKLSRAIKLAPNAQIYSIGSRSLEKAKEFAFENEFPPETKVYGSYEEVLDDESVDAVYIPLPTSLHLRWAVMAAEKKKHVLLEKPTALHLTELDQILDACEVNGVQFMDATMWMHHPRTDKMMEVISDRELFGEINSVHSIFTYSVSSHFLKHDIRVKPDLDSLGVLGDAGWYAIRAILWAMNYELPKKVTALHGPIFNESGVLLSCGSALCWKDGKTATFYCSFLSNLTMDITVTGTKGSLNVKDFVIPYVEKSAGFSCVTGSKFDNLSLGWGPLPSEERKVVTDFPQEVLMVTEFSKLVAAIKGFGSEPEKKWPVITRKTQAVLDAVKASIEKDFQTIEI